MLQRGLASHILQDSPELLRIVDTAYYTVSTDVFDLLRFHSYEPFIVGASSASGTVGYGRLRCMSVSRSPARGTRPTRARRTPLARARTKAIA